MEIAAGGLALLFGLLLLGMPIGFAMALVGLGGTALVIGGPPALSLLGTTVASTAQSYELSVIPLFVLMGNFVVRAGLSRDLYRAANAFLGHFRGGLALSTIAACAGFSAVSGSSLATVATMSKVAVEPMQRYGYGPGLVAGSVAAGGTLGILIPPSVPLILYGVITGTDIGKLFVAGILPGLLGVLLYMAAILVVTGRDPASGPPSARAGRQERLASIGRTWGIGLLFTLVLGGIYLGVFTATEAAGIGAFGAWVLAQLRAQLSLRDLVGVLAQSFRITAVLFTVLIGALVFANFMNLAGLPNWLGGVIARAELPPTAVILLICAIYVLLGAVLESVSMMLLTVPLFFPIAMAQGVDPVWFGILVVVVIEISLITPPIGMNVFVLKAMVPDYSLRQIFGGVMPFVLADVLRLALLLALPGLALFLPGLMGR
ncbi:MAG: C4-dicarboxylate ABC transporter permease [Alphaproteobacteria bacterium HGW-Alphaproteobacteria-2]|nr:MAG: C4-dicarboxylate ABC transporter permease [Alphaproteobacteria bacterium HGW-Alphaproteobacteria-2]